VWRAAGSVYNEAAKGAGMAFDRLADLLFGRVQLHGTSNAPVTLCDTHDAQPLLIVVRFVVDDLAVCQGLVAVKHLLRLGLSVQRPMVGRCSCDEGDGVVVDPSPIYHSVGQCCSLHLGFLVQVEDLKRVSGLEGDDVLRGMLDRIICRDGSAYYIPWVLHIDDSDL